MQAPLSPEQFGGVLNYLPGYNDYPRELRDDLIRRTAALIGLELLIFENDDTVDGDAIDNFAGHNSGDIPDFLPDCSWTILEGETRPTVFLARLPGGREDLPLLGERLHILYETVRDLSVQP